MKLLFITVSGGFFLIIIDHLHNTCKKKQVQTFFHKTTKFSKYFDSYLFQKTKFSLKILTIQKQCSCMGYQRSQNPVAAQNIFTSIGNFLFHLNFRKDIFPDLITCQIISEMKYFMHFFVVIIRPSGMTPWELNYRNYDFYIHASLFVRSSFNNTSKSNFIVNKNKFGNTFCIYS